MQTLINCSPLPGAAFGHPVLLDFSVNVHGADIRLPHIIFFGGYVLVLIPMLYYYRRRNPNPRFRPSMGEMTMITVIAVMIGATASWFLGNVFRGEQRLDNTVPDQGAGWSSGTSGARESGGDSRYRKD